MQFQRPKRRPSIVRARAAHHRLSAATVVASLSPRKHIANTTLFWRVNDDDVGDEDGESMETNVNNNNNITINNNNIHHDQIEQSLGDLHFFVGGKRCFVFMLDEDSTKTSKGEYKFYKQRR